MRSLGLSFDPMPATRALTIGLVGDALDPVTGRCLDGMVAYARFHDAVSVVDLRLARDRPGAEPVDLPDWVGAVDGVVIAGGLGRPEPPLPAWPGLDDLPTVSLMSDPAAGRHPVVAVDPEQVASLAVEHLSQLGVASFLHVGIAGCGNSRRHAQGFARVVANRGRAALVHDLDAPINGDFGDIAMPSHASLGRALTLLPKPAGVLCIDDRVARAVVLGCRPLGLAVPADVAVVGLDDSPFARHATPSITSIRIPYESLAARATAMVCGMIRAGTTRMPDGPDNLMPASLLVPRESTNGRDGEPIGRWLCGLDQQGAPDSAIERIATELGVSRRTFERQFLRLFGHSPAEEIRRRRLDRAKQLLEDQAVPIAEVAGMVGFTVTAFSRFFRKHTGCTPRDYRQQAADRLLGPPPAMTEHGSGGIT